MGCLAHNYTHVQINMVITLCCNSKTIKHAGACGCQVPIKRACFPLIVSLSNTMKDSTSSSHHFPQPFHSSSPPKPSTIQPTPIKTSTQKRKSKGEKCLYCVFYSVLCIHFPEGNSSSWSSSDSDGNCYGPLLFLCSLTSDSIRRP